MVGEDEGGKGRLTRDLSGRGTVARRSVECPQGNKEMTRVDYLGVCKRGNTDPVYLLNPCGCNGVDVGVG